MGILYNKDKRPNKFGLPSYIVLALSYNDQDEDDTFVEHSMGVTRLIDSPKIGVLKKLHRKEIMEEKDISEDHYFIFGSMVHTFIERAIKQYNIENPDGVGLLSETRLVFPITHPTEGFLYNFNGIIDLIEVLKESDHPDYDYDVKIVDFKSVKAYSYINQDIDSYQKQISSYAWGLSKVPVKVNGNEYKFRAVEGEICMLIKDWSAADAQQQSNYPPHPYPSIKIPLIAFPKMETYIMARAMIYKDVAEGDPQLYQCSKEERWQREDEYAVYTRPDAGRAKSVFKLSKYTDKTNADPQADAYAELERIRGKYPQAFVEYRPGEPKRCVSYCDVAKYCKQWALESGRDFTRKRDVNIDAAPQSVTLDVDFGSADNDVVHDLFSQPTAETVSNEIILSFDDGAEDSIRLDDDMEIGDSKPQDSTDEDDFSIEINI